MKKRSAVLTTCALFALGVGFPAGAQAADRVAQEETTNDDDDGTDYGWIGLLGLAGLAGLLGRKRDDRVDRVDRDRTDAR